jgi:hypothetical protein
MIGKLTMPLFSTFLDKGHGIIQTIKIPEVFLLPVVHDLHVPFPSELTPVNPFETRSVSLASGHVFCITKWGRFSKILDTVIPWAVIDVIKVHLGESSVDVKPRQTVGQIRFPLDAYSNVAIGAKRAYHGASISIGSKRPKQPSFWVIVHMLLERALAKVISVFHVRKRKASSGKWKPLLAQIRIAPETFGMTSTSCRSEFAFP